MSYFLRELVPRDNSPSTSSAPSPSQLVSEQYGQLIKKYYPVRTKGSVLRIPLSKDAEESQSEISQLPQLSSELCAALHVVGPPSSFATVAIAKTMLAKYGDLLEKKETVEGVEDSHHVDNIRDRVDRSDNTKTDQLVCVGMSCVFDILRQLSRRDPELCVQALNSLMALLQNLPVDSLRSEPKPSVESMMRVLRHLREEGSPSVCSRASSCLAALAVCSGLPDHLMEAVDALICTQRNEPQSTDSSYDDLQVPENLHRLSVKIQQKAHKGTETGNSSWSERPLDEHRVLCSFDLPTLPNDSPSDTPDDDMRLQGSIACDGMYVYVLNYVGFYKIGSGLQETVLGKLYASNSQIKATRNCLLTFCNGSLYLRRGQSSCISVIDTDSLRDIGEVILPTDCVQTALFSDGSSFYHASVTSQSTLHLIPLNDSFVPLAEPKSRHSVRLTDVSFCCMGDTKSTPYQLPLTIPKYLHNQAADLHLGKDIAFLQSRSGKIYYAGNGIKYGLQETGTTWMELVLPESIVQMSVGTEYVLFRAGSGHAWIAGGDDGRRAGKLRRLTTVNRRKTQSISSAAGSYAYVTDNGRVYVGGRHGMSVYPETGQVLGLDGTHMASIALGKTHAVAISKQGYVYTWGLNNLNQCGRTEQAPSSSTASPRRRGSVVACEPSEHLFVKDIPSYCAQCGLCSARGSACPLPAFTRKTGTCTCGPGDTTCLRCGLCRACGESIQQRPAGDTPTRTHLAPARVTIVKNQQNVKVSSVSCGNFHTILLAADGSVFSFGSNCHGQLGTGDVRSKTEPQLVVLPPDVQVVQVAAGANHTVLRTSLGAVFTFGAHKMGQLIRSPEDGNYWHATPGRVPGFGPGYESFATWIGAVGDATLIHSHTALIHAEDVIDAQLVASKYDLFIFPRQVGKEYVAIRRKHGCFAHHQLGPSGLYTSWCLESRYDILWSYNAAEMRVQANSIHLATSKEVLSDRMDSLAFLRSPEWAVPLESPIHCSSTQLGISLLSCTYAAATITKGKLWNEKDFLNSPDHAVSPSGGRSVVCRFESTGGGWGYSAHSIEAIQVKASKDIRLLGIGLYGGRGEYIAKIKLFRLPSDVSDEQCAELLSESDETLYDCGQRETAALMLAQPVLMKANHWHVVSAKISGPSSDCGATGRRIVECDDVTFTFRNSAISNNGTDVNVGQIPELYYQVVSSSGEGAVSDDEKPDDYASSRLFSSSSMDTVSPCAFLALLRVLDWSLSRVFEFHCEGDQRLWYTERAAATSLIVMRILSRYVLLVYRANGDSDEPCMGFADAVVLLHSALLSMFDRANDCVLEENFALTIVLNEAINLFVEISSCFMPSRHLLVCHLALAISSPVGHPLIAAVIGSIAKRRTLVDVFLHKSEFVTFPQLSKELAAHFTMEQQRVDTLTALPNILRFLYEKSFSESSDSWNVSNIAQDIVVKLSKELAIPDVHKSLASTIVQTPIRFRRRSAVCAWDMSDGATDAICIRVEGGRIALRGVGVYLQAEQVRRTWQCEIHVLRDGDQFSLLSKTSCELSSGGAVDTGVILLPDSVTLAVGVTYAIKVWTPENGKTYCGEGGVNYIRLTNGARVTFSSCPLSENGTSLQRGQIPFFLYSVVESEKVDVPEKQDEIHKSFVMLLRLLSNKIGAFLVNGLIPQCARSLISRIAGHVMVFMELFPNKAMEITCVLEQLIPMVSSVNATMKASTISESFEHNSEICEAKTTQITVECPHPYKTNNVYSLVVGFEETVHFVCVQFSPSCETAQADDQLRIYMGVNKESYVPVGRYFGSKDWPTTPLLLPGNSLWFVLETTAEVDGVTSEQMYGFHCTVTGYPASRKDSNLRLEQELAWLSASACRVMVQLSSDASSLTHFSTAEDDTRVLLEKHGSLLKKGLSLTHAPTLNELVQKGLPSSAQSADLVFLREFLSACSTSTAGFLARWLPSGPVVDPARCQLTIVQTDMAVGKPIKIRLTTKDQFDREVMCSSMCVEVSMTAGDASIYASARFASTALPSLELIKKNPFQPVLMNRCRYMSISAMPAYLNYSYEEIRLGFTKATVVREKINLKHKNNCTFEGEWTPTVAGSYRVACRVDGCELTHNYLIEISEREENTRRREHRAAQLSRATKAAIPATLPFQAIRMRLGTSLTAPCVGTIPRGGTISYIEKIENEDGKWLRLTDETAVLYGHGNVSGQVWCLAYHQHLRRELIPIATDVVDRPPVRRQEDPPTLHTSPTQQSVIIEANETYVLDATQRIQLYSRPSPDAVIEGALLEGRTELEGSGWVSNQHGVWVRVADTNQFILAENSIGRSSIQSQSLSINGNEEEERSPPARQQGTTTMASALRPSVAECCRTVFAAFLWHEHLVKDAMAAAAYLKFHQHLQNLWSNSDVRESAAPAALQPIVRLWIEVCTAVRASVDQHLIVPPAGGKALGSVTRKREASGGGCELCDCSFKVPVTVHMRMNHPGCGQDAQGYGYNSSGKFTSGWSGDCGSGGRAASTWYLLCPTCRAQYLRKTPAGHRQERTRRWREFRLSTNAFDSRPEIIMRQNAMFLLDLNSSLDCDSKASSAATSGWTINLFPTQTPSPSAMGRSGPIGKKVVDSALFARSSFLSQSLSKTGHASDPGPKALPTSPPAVPMQSLAMDGTRSDEGDTREVLQSPSAALRTLISHHTPTTGEMLKRPVLAFVVEHHDLKRLRAACEQSIIRAVGFSHAFRVWNWLLRLVSSETSVSDIILQYLAALSSYNSLADISSTQPVRVLPHPWRLCFLAGPLAAKMVQHLHAFLYTIAVILQSSGVDARLRSLCFKAWTIQLTAHEQELLILTCNILGTVGGVLSEPSISENWITDSADRSNVVQKVNENVDVKEMRDVTSHTRIEASSRQAMVVCLTDGSPETFWESGEEDKSRSRTLNVTFEGCSPVLLCLFIDNSRDEACRTSQVAFRAAMSDGSRRDLMSKNLDQNFCGWVKCCVANVTHVSISLKGPHNASRVRQLQVLGFLAEGKTEVIRPSASHQLFFNNTQHDAFALFQAISAQAFSGESCEQQDALRERVVDLLFSRVTLQPLQNYVCTQVEAALEREVERLCCQGKRNYSYAVGLLAMANRMCETRAIGNGDCDVAARHQVLQAASRLLAFAPEAVQTQCLSSLCSLLPTARASTVDISRLLRHLLVPVAKALVLQVRDKAAHSVTTATMNSCLTNAPLSWRTDRSVSPEIGKMTAQFISDVCSGAFNEDWSVCMRRELATALLGVVQLTTSLSKSGSRESMNKESVPSILNSKRFWLSVAALALVRDRSWLALSEKWNDVRTPSQEPVTLCENHDDGMTPAQVFCSDCECALCRECFSVMHLHKRNRSHRVTSLAPPPARLEEIDIHQGCARMRVANLLILFHGESLNGLVELPADPFAALTNAAITAGRSTSSVCRFCGNALDPHNQLVGVCSHPDCVRYSATACCRTLPCGHPCGGIAGEKQCLPCLICASEGTAQDGDDVCVVCFTDRLCAAPCVQLGCGHLLHYHCVRAVLEKRWPGPRIQFRFMNCPLCNVPISHPGLADLLDPLLALKADVAAKANMRLEFDGLLGCTALTDPQSEYFGKPEEYAMDRYMYVLCNVCNKAYFGGESRCQMALQSFQYNAAELVCGGCSAPAGTEVCGRHGAEYLEYKCRYCCSIAVYFCFGTTHFCAACHDDFQRLVCLPRNQFPPCPTGPRATPGEGPCPLRRPHPPAGEEFALGCGICRNISTF
ncbi:hypothetical protein Y032_0016g2930 [Ancylostoma ceylanicum]|uniref:RCR-type E3 ubiquitin transferase n=2 Tax=Ancylostoma ceylanicum TaxID=53326 RepID=A0A016V4Z7_9BILA|nr:hypothetical protein Y032_0016g2930 [Ancylostoma ceylanicum]